jgi:hypothetical protein
MPIITVVEQDGVGPDGATRPTEDRVVVLPNAVLLLDGATSSRPVDRNGGWYAGVLAAELASRLRAAPDEDLGSVLEAAIDQVAARYGLTPGDAPSSTVAMVRWNAEIVDALVLADSPVVMFGRTVDVVADTRLASLRGTVERIGEWRNREGGFWVAEALPAAARSAVRASWPRDEARAVLMASDGVSCGVDDYGLFADWPTVLDLVDAEGPQAVLDRVRAAERSDPNCERWHRYKVHDDQAFAVIRF